jgi:hypothetical protein
VRTHEQELHPERLVRAEMIVGMGRALRVMHLLTGTPKLHEDWLAASRAAVEQADDETRRVVTVVLQELLDIIASTPPDRT